MKPVRELTPRHHHQQEMGATRLTIRAATGTARLTQQPDPQKNLYKNYPQARLSILILSKAYPTNGYTEPT